MTYIQHLGATVWRRKNTILIGSGLIILLIFGLQYSSLRQLNGKYQSKNEEKQSPQALASDIGQTANVKFVENYQKQTLPTGSHRYSTMISEEKLMKRTADQSLKNTPDIEKQLGIPFVNIDYKNLYIPAQRIVHFDLKGAPPKISYFRKIFPLIKTLGATGILLEYEDMFPFKGTLKNIAAKNCYTEEEIKELLLAAEQSKLDVIPLVQTFGHLEFVLKHNEWSKLREVLNSPQALCPSRNASLDFIGEMVKQIMALHPNSKYLHIGCDEVYQMGECEICRFELRENLFLNHVRNTAKIIHEKFPTLRLIIWDDMLRHISQQSMQDIMLGKYVEPMVWVYAEDIYRFVQTPTWDKYAAVFNTAWTASAFKGAFGETLYIPNAKRHLENNLQWLYVMSQQARAFKNGFAGIVLTGWQRYDHFAVLCELLPASIPSLALSLLAVSHGYFNSSLRGQFLSALSCPEHVSSSRPVPFINLYDDPYLWKKLGRCMFPGSPVFKLTYRLYNSEEEATEYLKSIHHQKGWLTMYNVQHNFSSPLRIDELTAELPRIYHEFLALIKSTQDALDDVFDNYTILEWIEQRIYPYIIELEDLQNKSVALKNAKTWPSRPFPPLKDLQRLGITLPKE